MVICSRTAQSYSWQGVVMSGSVARVRMSSKMCSGRSSSVRACLELAARPETILSRAAASIQQFGRVISSCNAATAAWECVGTGGGNAGGQIDR